MKGALLVVERGYGPVFFAKWRDSAGRQVKRRLGPAWVVRSGASWRQRRGRVGAGALDERSAFVAMAEVIEAHEREITTAPAREATFADAVARWMHHLEFVKGVKPSTLADYRYLLAPIGAPARPRGRAPAARIMRTFAHRPLFESLTPSRRISPGSSPRQPMIARP